MNRSRPSTSGFSLVELLIAIGIATTLGLAIVHVLGGTAQIQSDSMSRAQVDLFRRELIRLVNANPSWQATLSGPLNASTLACLNSSSHCTVNGQPNGSPITNQPFAIYAANGSVFYNSASPGQGLSPQGLGCTNYSASGNDSCPYRYDLRWSAICETAGCTNPLIKVTANFRFTPKSVRSPMNPADFNIAIYRGPAGGSASVPPACNPLTHTNNSNSFTVSWIAGSGNGGPGGCQIQFQRTDGTWTPVQAPANVDCDADGSTAGTITLPGDGWLGGLWSAPVPVRVVRVADGAVMCDSGFLNCAARLGSAAPTPSIDEDCNSNWDNPQTSGGTCSGSLNIATTPGQAYSCPATYDFGNGCGAIPFNNVSLSVISSFKHYEFYSDPGCTVAMNPAVGFESADVVYSCRGYGAWLNNTLNSPSGTVPSETSYYGGPVSGVLDITGGCTAYSQATFPPQCNGRSGYVKLNSPPGQWDGASCMYQQFPTTLHY